MEIFIIFFVTPLVGMLLFLTCISLMKRLIANKSIHNEKIIGSVLTFIFIVLIMISLGMLDY